jgi:uridylate kinase
MESHSEKTLQRVLLKLSGESLNGEQPSCYCMKAVLLLANHIRDLSQQGHQMAVVIGGGNIWRGRDAGAFGISQVSADIIGMTATLLNALVFQAMLEKIGQKTKILSPNPIDTIIEKHHWKKAVDYLEQGFVVLFAGGTGCPLFSTDTASALRAVEINADIILKATTVDHVYNDDPKKNHHAVSYNDVSYEEIIHNKLKVIDENAAIICRDHKIKMRIFSILDPQNLIRALEPGTNIGTLVSAEKQKL